MTRVESVPLRVGLPPVARRWGWLPEAYEAPTADPHWLHSVSVYLAIRRLSVSVRLPYRPSLDSDSSRGGGECLLYLPPPSVSSFLFLIHNVPLSLFLSSSSIPDRCTSFEGESSLIR
ncbi:Hypothetical protein NTJ_10642 [Nesidiocoris tenuis]|uniref:Uncharacterized protein n=1 Tax=Nesidiocoris tenuis TaxID=355587 RepID=A0ABN7B083_9HEMI|nr:Hypothetical protein NTJ_10642 [Nesidiocoris tenuis]